MTAQQPGLTFILGGARAGKSTFAEQLAARHGPNVTYVATATPGDEEMRGRIAAHRAARPALWRTLEEPLDPAGALRAAAVGGAVLLDCLTLLTSNLVLRNVHPDAVAREHVRRTEECVMAAVDALLAWQRECGVPLYVVSNEVGLGVIPPYPLGRAFQDILGRANQRVAAVASEAFLVVAGLALPLKALGAQSIDAPPPLSLDWLEHPRAERPST